MGVPLGGSTDPEDGLSGAEGFLGQSEWTGRVWLIGKCVSVWLQTGWWCYNWQFEIRRAERVEYESIDRSLRVGECFEGGGQW
jgi:hypothetical protein